MDEKRNKRVLLIAKESPIEPLGLLHLAGVAKEEAWESKIVLVKSQDFNSLDREILEFNPSLIGFTLYTGNHLQTFKYLSHLKITFPNIQTILGGPHPTYFPKECEKHADYIVLSEGLNAFRKILRGEANKGVLPLEKQEKFPIPDRTAFYNYSDKHNNSEIKSIITQTGCPFSCTYCYNSSKLSDISSDLESHHVKCMEKSLGPSQRLFPTSVRAVDDIIAEVENIRKVSPKTKMIYFQDDLFGVSINWMREFAKKYPSVGLPFHAQMRFEFANPENPICKERIELMKECGCTGMTFAIESSNPIVRTEVLNRYMPNELMFNVFDFLNKLNLRVRTEQMLGLPYGATSEPTPVGIDADLETLELNCKLKEKTELPTMAWASIFAPYRGTKIGNYCHKHGFYTGVNNDVPDTFFERSVLQFPKKWVGPTLSLSNPNLWMNKEELENYRTKLQFLRDHFSFFANVPDGHKLARKILSDSDLPKYDSFDKHITPHLNSLPNENPAVKFCKDKTSVEVSLSATTNNLTLHSANVIKDLSTLKTYFSCIPKGELALKKVLDYSQDKTQLDTSVLSTAIRHHLYDNVLYDVHNL
ncbi:MAG: cobalamin-dependent protein [Candidatus Pacearchaeota archaeon]